jgi:predicted DNA-binding transcriptional regulator AlpA
MRKVNITLFCAIVLFVGSGSVAYYYRDKSNNLYVENLSRKYKSTEVLTKGFQRAYNSKKTEEVEQTDTMTKEQVMKYLGISVADLGSLIEDNTSTFPYSKINGTITFRKSSIDKWLEKCHVNAIEK